MEESDDIGDVILEASSVSARTCDSIKQLEQLLTTDTVMIASVDNMHNGFRGLHIGTRISVLNDKSRLKN